MKIKIFVFLLVFSIVNSSKVQDEEYYKKLGDFYLDKQEYEDAIRVYKKILPLKKRGICKDIGYAYLQLGRYEEAEKFLKEEIVLNPEDYDSILLLGCLYFKWGKIEKALEIFTNYLTQEKALEKSKVISKKLPNLGLARYALGLCLKRKGELNRAIKYFSDSINMGYEKAKNIVQIVDIFISKGDYSSALKELEMANVQSPELYFLKGYINYEVGNIKESLENFLHAVRLEPGFKEARKNIAIIHYNLGNYKEAQKRFKSLNMRFPDDPLLEMGYIKALIEKSKSESSEKIPITKHFIEDSTPEFKYELRNDKDKILNSLNSDGLNMIKAGMIKEGISKFIIALNIDPKSPEANYNLGLMFLNLGNYEDAYLYAQRAVDNKKDFLNAWDLLGNAFFHLREFEKSISAYKRVVELNPRDALGYYNLGCAYYGAKLYSEAENAWVNAIKHDKRGKEKAEGIDEKVGIERSEVKITVLKRTVSFHSYKSLGSLYKEMGEIEKAIESYIRAIELFPADAECYYELGKLYIERGEKEKAIKCFEKYLEHGTEKEGEVRELLKRLKEKIK